MLVPGQEARPAGDDANERRKWGGGGGGGGLFRCVFILVVYMRARDRQAWCA